MRYAVWSNNDPNDFFWIEADNVENAAFEALSALGWSISNDAVTIRYGSFEDDEDFPEHEGLDPQEY